ncbi:MAG: hypothetical protein A3K46_05965 [Chloroflexi bacterium RBG_13_60_9]|nr:MAG: hypothetical protein A3K46_05965 [Chloroflexi bacterium RBG_13_60_9]
MIYLSLLCIFRGNICSRCSGSESIVMIYIIRIFSYYEVFPFIFIFQFRFIKDIFNNTKQYFFIDAPK